MFTTVVVLPQVIGGTVSWPVLLLAAGIALITPVIWFGLEMTALRRVTHAAFGTLLAIEPAFGVLVGLLVLSQTPSTMQITGIALVVLAGAAAQRGAAAHRWEPLSSIFCAISHTDIVQPSGPSKHFFIRLASLWARHTCSTLPRMNRANRTCVSLRICASATPDGRERREIGKHGVYLGRPLTGSLKHPHLKQLLKGVEVRGVEEAGSLVHGFEGESHARGREVRVGLLQTPDGHGQLGLFEYIHSKAVESNPTCPNDIGMHRVTLAVDNIDKALEVASKHGCHPLSGVATYSEVYKLTYFRGPRGILVMLAENLQKD